MTPAVPRALVLAGLLSRYQLFALDKALGDAIITERRNGGGPGEADLLELAAMLAAAKQLVITHAASLDVTPVMTQNGPPVSLYNMTSADVATMLDLTEGNVRQRADRGTLPGVKQGRFWRFNRSEVIACERQR